MKKLFAFILAAMLVCQPVCAGQIIGSVYSTQIRAFINYMPVPSYNFDGTTVVAVRDLERLGFAVYWDEKTSRVSFFKQDKPAEPELPVYKPISDSPQKLFDVYESDITVYYGSIEIPSYNVGGRVVIPFRSLDLTGSLSFDSAASVAELRVGADKIRGEELEYVEKHRSLLYLLSQGDYYCKAVCEMADAGASDSRLINALDSYIAKLEDALSEYRGYEEPKRMEQSSMELWWAMVNSMYAADELYNSLEPTEEYELFASDSVQQRKESLRLLAAEVGA